MKLIKRTPGNIMPLYIKAIGPALCLPIYLIILEYPVLPGRGRRSWFVIIIIIIILRSPYNLILTLRKLR